MPPKPARRAGPAGRSLLVVAGLSALAALGCRWPGSASRAPAPGAPVVLISIDTLRADRLPSWGYRSVATPAIDALARDGIVFEEAWAQVPQTLPSHVSLLTGELPPETGVRDNIGYLFDPARHPTLPQRLAARGYATGASISAHVLRAETGLGGAFEFYSDAMPPDAALTLGELQRSGRESVAEAGRFLDRVGDRPFFLLLHLFEPHAPYTPPAPFASRYADPYDGEIAAADAFVGELLAELRRRGRYDGTLVVLLSDHGEGLGDHGEREHGLLLYREALHVPLIVKLPGSRSQGRRITAPVALVDVVPTVLEAVGVPQPAGLAGRSLLPLLDGAALPAPRVYSETLYPRLHFGWSELRSIRDGPWHLIEGPDPELYDLASDPAERTNRREDHRRELGDLRAALGEIPLRLEPPQPTSAEEIARLAALGYLGAPAGRVAGPLPDPKRNLEVLEDVLRVVELARHGRHREVLELCRRLLEGNPQLTDVRAQYATSLRQLGRPEEALAEYREAIRRAPTMAGSLALEIAKLELERGRLDAAEQNARLAVGPRPAEAHPLLAAVAIGRGDYAGAEREARAGLGDPARPRLPALLLLAQALAFQGRLDEALVAAEQAQAQIASGAAPPQPTLDSTLGDIYARMNRMAEAESAFRREIAAFPTTLSAYLRLAGLLAAERRFEEIIPLLDGMVRAAPAPATCLQAAAALEQLGNREAAAAFRRRARDLERRSAPPAGRPGPSR